MCGKCIGGDEKLRRHMIRKHEGISEFECVQCGKYISGDKKLRRHMIREHEGISEFECV